jgi:hypothetical protein
MGDVTVHRMPWEPAPIADTVALLQRDFAYAVINTAILVHSNQAALRMLVNTARGQIIPRGTGRFIDGSTVEFQDLGMPQPNAPTMTVEQLIKQVADVARELGLTPL